MTGESLHSTSLKSDAGVSLVEAAVAIIVLGVVLVGLFPLILDSIRLSVQNSEVAEANRIVASQLDKARSALAPPVDCAPQSKTPLVLNADEAARFTGTQTVTCVDTLATVTIEVHRKAAPDFAAARATTQMVTG